MAATPTIGQNIPDKYISPVATQVLHALIYFDIFDYPLTAKEVFERSAAHSYAEVQQELEGLSARGVIFKFKDFYSIKNNPALVYRRLKGNQKAIKEMKKARFMTGIIRHFPFVRSVMLSGSISKMYMDEKSDIDYFIITAPNRLWITRLFFIMFQKILLLNRTKILCYNYMISADHLQIGKQNIYTATEAITLIPTYGVTYYNEFLAANDWICRFFPNFPARSTTGIYNGESWVKQVLEGVFKGNAGERVDTWLMKKTEKRWRKRHPPAMFTESGEYLHLKRHTAKAHTEGHGPRILQQYQENLVKFQSKY